MRTCLGSPLASSDSKLILLLLYVREERIEKAGVLGKADVKNAELDAIEASLREAAQQGSSDPFCDYLLGLVLADRWARAAVAVHQQRAVA
jgi:hypothetical protein